MYCRKCGHHMTEDKKFCGGCGTIVDPTASPSVIQEPSTSYVPSHDLADKGSEKKSGSGNVAKTILAAVCIFFLVGVIFSGSDDDQPQNKTSSSSSGSSAVSGESTEPPVNEVVLSDSDIEYAYKKSCVNYYDYGDIFRNSHSYVGLPATFTGYVYQAIYEGTSAFLLVDVATEYDREDKLIWASFDTSTVKSKVLEGDVIHIYGNLDDVYSYESLQGLPITVPKMDIIYIDNVTAGFIPTPPPTRVPEARPVVNHHTLTKENVIDLYCELLEHYQHGTNTKWLMSDYELVGLSPLMVYYPNPLVAFWDYSNDGIDEMLIANEEERILLIYTIEYVNGRYTPVLLGEITGQSGITTGCGKYLATTEKDSLEPDIIYEFKNGNLDFFYDRDDLEWTTDKLDYKPFSAYI